MTSNSALQARREAAVPRGVGTAYPVFAKCAEGSELWDVEDRRYVDFGGGIAVLNTGHRHPKVVAAVRDQLDHFTHTAFQVVPYEPYIALCERLNALAPFSGEAKTILFSSGAEAVENAVKIARAATNRSAIIAFTGAFHGRTFMGMTLTGKVVPYKAGFGAMMPDVFHVPFPVELHGTSIEDSLSVLDKLFKADVDPARVAAFIVEPVQGEGGFYEVPKAFMVKLRELADKHGILLIADEVQTGFARTGKLFAMEHYGVIPDITTMAKGLGGGFPIAAVTGRAEIMDAPGPGGLGGTYGGNPIGIAAGNAVLDVIEEEGLNERAERLGSRLKQRLHSLISDVPQIADIRGLGFMNAVEFNIPGTRNPNADFTNKIREKALEKGLILLTCGVYGNVIRFLAPLTIQDEVFAEALDILEDTLRECAKEAA